MRIGIAGELQAGFRFIEKLEFPGHLANIGDTKILVLQPAITMQRQLGKAQQIGAGLELYLI